VSGAPPFPVPVETRRPFVATIQVGVKLSLDEIADVCRRYRVRDLSRFGSALPEDFRPESDVDLLVEFEPGTGGTCIPRSTRCRRTGSNRASGMRCRRRPGFCMRREERYLLADAPESPGVARG
jgi:hypothetical protein